MIKTQRKRESEKTKDHYSFYIDTFRSLFYGGAQYFTVFAWFGVLLIAFLSLSLSLSVSLSRSYQSTCMSYFQTPFFCFSNNNKQTTTYDFKKKNMLKRSRSVRELKELNCGAHVHLFQRYLLYSISLPFLFSCVTSE